MRGMSLYRFSKLPAVNQSKTLTEGGKLLFRIFSISKSLNISCLAWKKMESNLIAFVANERILLWQPAIKSRCAILKGIYDSLRVHLPFNMAIPNIADLAVLHSIRSLILDTHYSITITLADFEGVFERILEFFSSWLAVADKAILDIVRNSSIGPNATKSTLPLATTLFNCSSCSNILHYPRVLVHSCLQTAAPSDGDESENMAYMFSCLKCRPSSWNNQKKITFDESAHKHMKALLALYCFEPGTSFDSLQDFDPFVERLGTVSSATSKYEREVMRMTVAVGIASLQYDSHLLVT
jgi:hypothetical protein